MEERGRKRRTSKRKSGREDNEEEVDVKVEE